jgi:hypothetical protein
MIFSYAENPFKNIIYCIIPNRWRIVKKKAEMRACHYRQIFFAFFSVLPRDEGLICQKRYGKLL